MLGKNRRHEYAHENTCQVAGKKKYKFAKATRDSKKIRSKYESNHAPYRCKYCTYFHIGSSTSQRVGARSRRREQ